MKSNNTSYAVTLFLSPIMSSQSPKSSTTFSSSSMDTCNDEGYASPFISYRDQSGEKILEDLRDLETQGVYYAANKEVNAQCEFISNKDVKGDILIAKDGEKPNTEFVLAGIFQVDARNFFMTLDGKWNQHNQFGTRFEQVRPTCHLLPVVRDPGFKYSMDDFPSIVANIQAIENKVNPQKTREHVSVILNNPVAIKLTHHLFVV